VQTPIGAPTKFVFWARLGRDFLHRFDRWVTVPLWKGGALAPRLLLFGIIAAALHTGYVPAELVFRFVKVAAAFGASLKPVHHVIPPDHPGASQILGKLSFQDDP